MNNRPDYRDICEAAMRLKDKSIYTAVLSSPKINEQVGSEVFFKCENQQHIGAFKFRGAYNAIIQLSDLQKKNGVIAFSSGNHAQAVARVCQMLDIKATIIMPNNAPDIKRRGTEILGANIIEYDPLTENRETIAQQVNADNRLSLIPPFNHPHIIAGQGTAAYELASDVKNLDQLLAPCGGGGLLSGTALAVKGLQENCAVIGVEPEMADDATQSFQQGKIITIDYPDTIADGTQTLSLGEITFGLIQSHVDDMVTVSEAMIKEAVRLLFYNLKQVVEPSGALGLAALLERKTPPANRVGVIISGGNIDGKMMQKILAEPSIT